MLEIPKDRYPDAAEMTAIASYIKEKHYKVSIDSMLLAFELYISKKLDEAPEKYERFGPMLIERVMQSYTRYSFNILHSGTSGDTPDEMDKIRATTTPAQLEEKIKADCIKAFERYKAKGGVFDPGNYMYRFLVRHGVLNFSEERKKEIRGRVNQLNMGIFKKAIGGDMDQQARLEMATCDLEMMELFNDLIDTGTELSEMFENSPEDVRS